MPRPGPRMELLGIRVPAELKVRIRRAAAAAGVGRSVLVRELLTEGLDKRGIDDGRFV